MSSPDAKQGSKMETKLPRGQNKRAPSELPLWKQRLTRRQAQIVDLFQEEGTTNKDIAEKLGVTEKTVKLHFTGILKKSGAKSRYELLRKVQQMRQHGFRRTYWP